MWEWKVAQLFPKLAKNFQKWPKNRHSTSYLSFQNRLKCHQKLPNLKKLIVAQWLSGHFQN